MSEVNFSCEKHQGQLQKDSRHNLYVGHPGCITSQLCDAGGTDVDWPIAALLRDTVEDIDTTNSKVAESFS